MIYTSNTLSRSFSHTLLTDITSTLQAQLWPSSTISLMPNAAPPTVRQAPPIHPRWELIALPHAPTRERRSSTPHADASLRFPLTPAKPISPPTSPIRSSHIAGETLLSNPLFTIPDPPKTNLVLDPPKTDLVAAVEDRSRWPNLHLFLDLFVFPLISHSFFLLSSSLWIKNVFILIFGCVKCIFWNFLL